jgi:hypothetical protein
MKMNGVKKGVAALDNAAIVSILSCHRQIRLLAEKEGSGYGKHEVIHAQGTGDIKIKA